MWFVLSIFGLIFLSCLWVCLKEAFRYKSDMRDFAMENYRARKAIQEAEINEELRQLKIKLGVTSQEQNNGQDR